MSQLETQIALAIGDIAQKAKNRGRLRYPNMPGKVVAGSIDTAALTCSVILDIDDDGSAEPIQTTGVTLGVKPDGSTNGLILYPADGSNVVVGELEDGSGWTLLRCSDLTRLQVVIGGMSFTIGDKIQLNDGSLGGLVKLLDLVAKLNKLENDLNTLKNVLKTWTPVANDGGAALKAAASTWAGQQLQVTQRGDIENTNITQG